MTIVATIRRSSSDEVQRRTQNEPYIQLALPSWANDLSEDQVLELIERCALGPLYPEDYPSET